MPISGRAGTVPALDLQEAYPPARSTASENYVPRTSRGELTSSGGCDSTWLKDVAGGGRLSCKNSFAPEVRYAHSRD